ncbi:MAG: preprotein translocase subunit SecG [Treponema sp.]|nr:preprotein translocase subunit SecG [Treponema sp.]
MGAIKVILMVAFVIVCVLLVLLVLIQNDEGGGLGGLMNGSGSAAFGSHSASVINKATFVLVALFIVTAFFIARLNKKPAIKSTLSPSVQESVDTSGAAVEEWYKYLDADDAASESSEEETVLSLPEEE